MRNNMGLHRGKRIDNDKWVEGYFVKKFDPLLLTEMCFILVQEYDTSCIDGTPTVLKSEMTWYRVHPESVGQYTGLNGKNGKIFEGDIVKIAYCFGWDDTLEKDVPEEEHISKVYSIDACPFCVDIRFSDGDFSPIAWLDWICDDVEIEVIGNIHDNPEMMEE